MLPPLELGGPMGFRPTTLHVNLVPLPLQLRMTEIVISFTLKDEQPNDMHSISMTCDLFKIKRYSVRLSVFPPTPHDPSPFRVCFILRVRRTKEG